MVFQLNSLRCTPQEKDFARSLDFETKYTFGGENAAIQQRFTIPSSMRPGKPGSIIAEGDSELYYMTLDLDVTEDGGVFSVIAMTDFSDLNVFLSLVDSGNRLVAVEKTAMLDSVQTNNDQGLNEEEGTATEAPGSWDMLHSIELPELSKDRYTLKIGLPRAYWMKQQKFETCLSFDFIMEYMRKTSAVSTADDDDDQPTAYTVVAVAPPSKRDLGLGSTLALTVMFDAPVEARQLAANLPDASRICRLQSVVQENRYLNPARQYYRQRQGQLHFEFAKDADRIKDAYTNNGRSRDSGCYRLSCITEPMFEGGAYIRPFQAGQDFQYCFGGLDDEIDTYRGEIGVVKCNPYAKAKVADGSCVCTFPYTGADCESCAAGYTGRKTQSRIGSVKQRHTVCVADVDSDEGECNGFGTWRRSQKTCVCQSGYAGAFCETCSDARLKFPECTFDGDIDSLDEDEKQPEDTTSMGLRNFVA